MRPSVDDVLDAKSGNNLVRLIKYVQDMGFPSYRASYMALYFRRSHEVRYNAQKWAKVEQELKCITFGITSLPE